MKKLILTFLVVAGFFVYVSNVFANEQGQVDGPRWWPYQGKAIIKGTTGDSPITGEVNLAEDRGGLIIDAKVMHVPPGKHGFHFHENGSCEEMGKAAGGHFNPDKVTHGYLPKDGFMHAHAGDLGNIEVGPDGTGTLHIFLSGLCLADCKHAVAGKSVILHEKPDDFSQPTGNAGGRIGCGIIEVQEKK
ncbi:MAG: superoxide dismutase family protein [Candidatus Omnitrophica bacterium]|nr:superoxide dismutase family protein [Candidatus Omnitrophota bacterium]